MSRDLKRVVYSSSNTTKPGIWKVRPDGQDATRIVQGPLHYVPDVSPDGRCAAYLLTDQVNLRNTIRVVEIETGRDSGFEIEVRYGRQMTSGDVTWGRARWSPDGQWLLFIGQDEAGRAAVFRPRFSPGTDTSATRQHIVSSLPGALTESLMMSPDGRFITVSDGYYVRRLVLAEHVRGVIARKRAP
jgi:Tol biopolymer transport system component